MKDLLGEAKTLLSEILSPPKTDPPVVDAPIHPSYEIKNIAYFYTHARAEVVHSMIRHP